MIRVVEFWFWAKHLLAAGFTMDEAERLIRLRENWKERLTKERNQEPLQQEKRVS